MNWCFVHNFSLGNVMANIEKIAPTIIRQLKATTIPPTILLNERAMSQALRQRAFCSTVWISVVLRIGHLAHKSSLLCIPVIAVVHMRVKALLGVNALFSLEKCNWLCITT